MSQSLVKLSQNEALMIEQLRKIGLSDDQIITGALNNKLPIDESEFEFDYSQLSSFAKENTELFQAAITEGYMIKYNTIRGIRCWIVIVFDQEPRLEFEAGKEAVYATLNAEQQQKLARALSFGWQLQVLDAEKNEISITPVRG